MFQKKQEKTDYINIRSTNSNKEPLAGRSTQIIHISLEEQYLKGILASIVVEHDEFSFLLICTSLYMT